MKILYIRTTVNGTCDNRTTINTFFFPDLWALFSKLIGNCKCKTDANEKARALIAEILGWEDDKEIKGFGFNCKVLDLEQNKEIPRLELVAFLSQNIETIHAHQQTETNGKA